MATIRNNTLQVCMYIPSREELDDADSKVLVPHRVDADQRARQKRGEVGERQVRLDFHILAVV